MMELIESSRVLEANVNMIHYQDDSLSRLLDSLPRK
jgi:flagellar basal body rod protein FlgG